jgi:hypothetical protein
MIITIDNLLYNIKEISFPVECSICYNNASYSFNNMFLCRKCLDYNLNEITQNILKLNWGICQILYDLNKYVFEKILDYDYEICYICKNKASYECNFNYIHMKLCQNCLKKKLTILLDNIL